MSSGYKVDLSALDEVIKNLNKIVGGMGSPKQKATYDTYLPEGWLGTIFGEEATFREAHNSLKGDIERYIGTLERLVDDFGKKTSKARRNYDEGEQESKSSVSSSSAQ